MKKLFYILSAVLLLASCHHSSNQKQQDDSDTTANITLQTPIDTLAMTLDALRNKRLPEGYVMLGDVKTDELTYIGFSMGDIAHFMFKNSSGNTVSFNGNDTNVELVVPDKPDEKKSVVDVNFEPDDSGGNYPNTKYLNKKFRVVWRTIQLREKPQNETEFFLQEYDEIIYMKEVV